MFCIQEVFKLYKVVNATHHPVQDKKTALTKNGILKIADVCLARITDNSADWSL